MILGIVLVRIDGFETLFNYGVDTVLKRVLMIMDTAVMIPVFSMDFDGFDTALMALERFLFMVWTRFRVVFGGFWTRFSWLTLMVLTGNPKRDLPQKSISETTRILLLIVILV